MPLLPSKVQQGAFGSRSAAPAGGSIVPGRVPQPRVALIQRGTAQGAEHFTTKEGELDAPAVARALNALQDKIAHSTAQSRANPWANGHLFQGVPVQGPLMAGPVGGGLPLVTNLAPGFMFYDTTSKKPFYYDGAGNWRDAASTIITGTTAGSVLTAIEHGFGTPAVGFFITNVAGGVIGSGAKIVPAGDATDKTIVRLLLPYYQSGAAQITADIYVFY